MAAGGLATKGAGLLKKPAFRIQATDVQTAALWGVAAGATAIWVVQLLGMVLSILKGIAEKNLGAAVVDCCIGIPVYFTDLQGRAVMDAATIAGLHPLHLIHETTATALTYGICKTDLPESDPLKILSHAFDRYLGGRDFDEALFQHFAACEKVKKVLNANPASPLNIECLMDEKDLKGFIKREEFEEICVPILERVKKPLEEAIFGAGLSGTKMARRIGGVDEHTMIFMEYEFEKKNIGAILVFDPGGGIILGTASGIAYPHMQGSVVYYGHTKSANKSYELRGHDFSLSQLASSSYAKHLIALAPAATSHWICHLTKLHVATGDNASAQQFVYNWLMMLDAHIYAYEWTANREEFQEQFIMFSSPRPPEVADLEDKPFDWIKKTFLEKPQPEEK